MASAPHLLHEDVSVVALQQLASVANQLFEAARIKLVWFLISVLVKSHDKDVGLLEELICESRMPRGEPKIE